MSRPSLSRWRSSPSSYYLLLCFMHNLQILRNRTILPVSMLIHSYYHPFKFTLCTNKLSIPKLIFALLQFLNFYSSIPFLYSHLRNLKKSLTCLSASNFLPQSLRCMLCLPAWMATSEIKKKESGRSSKRNFTPRLGFLFLSANFPPSLLRVPKTNCSLHPSVFPRVFSRSVCKCNRDWFRIAKQCRNISFSARNTVLSLV